LRVLAVSQLIDQSYRVDSDSSAGMWVCSGRESHIASPHSEMPALQLLSTLVHRTTREGRHRDNADVNKESEMEPRYYHLSMPLLLPLPPSPQMS
jgi:hypothetical protein